MPPARHRSAGNCDPPTGSADAYVAVGGVGARPVRGAASLATLVPVAGAVWREVRALPDVVLVVVATVPGTGRTGQVAAGGLDYRVRGTLLSEHHRGGGQGAGPGPLQEVPAAPSTWGGLFAWGSHG